MEERRKRFRSDDDKLVQLCYYAGESKLMGRRRKICRDEKESGGK